MVAEVLGSVPPGRLIDLGCQWTNTRRGGDSTGRWVLAREALPRTSPDYVSLHEELHERGVGFQIRGVDVLDGKGTVRSVAASTSDPSRTGPGLWYSGGGLESKGGRWEGEEGAGQRISR